MQSLDRLIEKFELPDQERASYLIDDLAKISAAGNSVEKFLDMGAGSGSMSAVVLEKFPSSHGILVDVVSRLQLKKYLPELDDSRYSIIEMSEMESVARESFDLVLFMDVVEHIPDWKNALSNLTCYVKKGGYLYIQAPSNYPSPNWPSLKIYKNRFLGFFRKNNPSEHVRHGMSCKTILDFLTPMFVPVVASEGYVTNGKVYCAFKPRTHLLLKRNL